MARLRAAAHSRSANPFAQLPLPAMPAALSSSSLSLLTDRPARPLAEPAPTLARLTRAQPEVREPPAPAAPGPDSRRPPSRPATAEAYTRGASAVPLGDASALRRWAYGVSSAATERPLAAAVGGDGRPLSSARRPHLDALPRSGSAPSSVHSRAASDDRSAARRSPSPVPSRAARSEATLRPSARREVFERTPARETARIGAGRDEEVLAALRARRRERARE